MPSCSSAKPPPDPRDVLAVLAEFASGATGMMATVRAAPMFWRIHVFGTKGMAEARDEDTLIVGRIGETPQTHGLRPRRFAAKCWSRPSPTRSRAARRSRSRPAQMLDLIGAFEAIITSLATRAPAHING